MPSNNKTIISGLISTLQRKVEPAKLFDLLSRMHDDASKVYETLFEGPLPAVDGSQLILNNIPQANLPDSIAFLNTENIFVENQNITAELPEFTLSYLDTATNIAGSILGRLLMKGDGDFIISSNLDFDGTDYVLDDGALGAGIRIENGQIHLVQFDGINLIEQILIDDNGIIQIGEPTFVTDADPSDMVFANDLSLRGSNFLGTKTHHMIGVDVNDLVSIGDNPTGSTTGEGNISIPTSLAVDLPTAGATRNGILILDKDNKRLCYYVAGNRYKIALGTLF